MSTYHQIDHTAIQALNPEPAIFRYLELKFSLTPSQVQAALRAVGNDKKLVEGFIKKNLGSLLRQPQ